MVMGCASHTPKSAPPIAQAPAPLPPPPAPVSFNVWNGVDLHWLGDAVPTMDRGVSWGVPWPQGTIQPATTFALKDAGGNDVPIQTWPLAYWPDGSIKWTAVAATIGAGADE